ncbi:Spy/CpxP family protein refolding chaperone [Barnesiella viscericola]|uniref:Spy/CpxP family protein refolding chaperone n=1 Tax=Barnesiella viscericola TaxID=397865 RepID=UPI0023542721|nr:hypothetical protein [Barnesiella viscericola]
MKRTIVSVALVLALTMSAFAGNQDKKQRREKCEFPCEQMVKELNLSEKQVSQLKEANEQFAAEMKALREKKEAFQKSNQEAMKAARERRDATMKSVLTKDQYIQYLEQKLSRPKMRLDRNVRPMRRLDGKKGRMHMRTVCPENIEAPTPADAPAINPPAPEEIK